jgi:pimeloyl-ACP methyl ester carboxylesterase
MKEANLKINGKNVYYRVAGEGPAVILVHGFGEDGSIWQQQWESITGFRFIIPDLPGSGRSEIIDDMSLEGLADCMHSILSAELKEKERPVMLGHSMGGYITLAYAEKYVDQLRGLGLIHSTAFADSEEKKETRQKSIEFIDKNGAKEFLKTTIPNLYGPITKAEAGEKIEEHIRRSHNFSGAALVSYYVSMMQRPDRTIILKNSAVPVLLVMGRYDMAVPLEEGLPLAHMADLTYIHILEKSGHMGMVEEPELTNDLFTTFLTGLNEHHPE